MGLIEQLFSEWIERNYRQHEGILKKEDEKLTRKSAELANIDELAEQFEQRIEQNAQAMEEWLVKHMNSKK